METKFWYSVNDEGVATIVVESNDEGKWSHSVHLSTDEALADGDGAAGAYNWDAERRFFSPCTREQASDMVKFEF